MSVIAVAGGTGSIGRAVVEAILEQQKYKLVILARKVHMPFMIIGVALTPEIGKQRVSPDYRREYYRGRLL